MKPAVEIRTGSWPLLAKLVRPIRHQVFAGEQGIDPALLCDARDPECAHAVANLAGQPVGAGRIDCRNQGRVGRVAVLVEHRRRGIGEAIMVALERLAAGQGLTAISLHAQCAAIPFYLTLGYRCDGPEFLEAGIPHRTMVRSVPR